MRNRYFVVGAILVCMLLLVISSVYSHVDAMEITPAPSIVEVSPAPTPEPNHILTLQEIKDWPIGERMYVERIEGSLWPSGYMIRASDEKGERIKTKMIYMSLDELCNLGVNYRMWVRKPTVEESAAVPWE